MFSQVDGLTPLYNDTVAYRNDYSFQTNRSNIYRQNLYDNKDGVPQRTLYNITRPDRYGLLDPYANSTGQPQRLLVHNWS